METEIKEIIAAATTQERFLKRTELRWIRDILELLWLLNDNPEFFHNSEGKRLQDILEPLWRCNTTPEFFSRTEQKRLRDILELIWRFYAAPESLSRAEQKRIGDILELLWRRNGNPEFLLSSDLLSQRIARLEAAQSFGKNAPVLISGARQIVYVKFPDLNYIPAFPSKAARDIEYCLRLIQYCLVAGDASPIEDSELANAEGMASGFTLTASAAIAALNYIKANHGLREMVAHEADTSIDGVIAAIAKLAPPEDNTGKTSNVLDSEMGEILTLAEIYQQYPDQWVLIVEPDLDENLNVIRGHVLAHSPDQDGIYSQLSSTKNIRAAIEYTGQVPENIAFIL
ncbi:MAG TPA: hypothetical protein IGS52_05940 [Oscillatoriaceae cyanobacterium M33_DOE_052]|nr:hypothetical protein [Oscillatoriaceae cyanobacterium M33_DOE_052]